MQIIRDERKAETTVQVQQHQLTVIMRLSDGKYQLNGMYPEAFFKQHPHLLNDTFKSEMRPVLDALRSDRLRRESNAKARRTVHLNAWHKVSAEVTQEDEIRRINNDE